MDEQASVDKITSKILEDANRKSQDIVGEAESAAQEKIEAARRKGEAAKKHLIDETEKLGEQTKRKIVSEGKIKARTTILETKEKLIQQAFEKAEKRLGELPGDKGYPEMLRALARDTCIEMGGGELEIVVRKGDEKLLAKELKKLEVAVKKAADNETKLKVVTGDIGPGVVVKRVDGAVEIDSTFQTRLDILRSELRLNVSGVLF
jgi:V/A-type H+-transporting ATPase subunit E